MVTEPQLSITLRFVINFSETYPHPPRIVKMLQLTYENKFTRAAFTLVEIVIVIAIVVVIGIFAYTNLLGGKNSTDLATATTQIVASVRQVQSESASQSQGVAWGIHFANATNTTPYYAIFTGSSYASGTVQGKYLLPPTVAYVTSTLPVGSSEDVTFSKISGASSASTSIGLYLISNPSDVQDISISSIGQVSYGAAIGSSQQYIWVADGGNRVEKFNTSGVYQSQLGICSSGACVGTSTSGGFGGQDDNTGPAGVAIDSAGNIWVADPYANRVEKFNSSGVYQSQIGACSSGQCGHFPDGTNGAIFEPFDVAIDSAGNIWVADSDDARVEKFNSSGVYQSQLGICSSGACTATTTSGGFGSLWTGAQMAIDSGDNIWVTEWNNLTDQGNNRVDKFNSSGVYQYQLGCSSGKCASTSANGGFGNAMYNGGPWGVAIDSADNIWVGDPNDNRVEKFNSSGVYQSQLGICSSGACIATTTSGGLSGPSVIAIH